MFNSFLRNSFARLSVESWRRFKREIIFFLEIRITYQFPKIKKKSNSWKEFFGNSLVSIVLICSKEILLFSIVQFVLSYVLIKTIHVSLNYLRNSQLQMSKFGILRAPARNFSDPRLTEYLWGWSRRTSLPLFTLRKITRFVV